MNSKNKISLTLVMLAGLGAIGSLAGAEGEKEANFSQAKTMMLKMLDQRIEDLGKTKSCVSSAQNREELKSCRAEAKEERLELRKEIKENRELIKKERKERHEEKMQRKE